MSDVNNNELRHISLFKHLTDSELNRIVPMLKHSTFAEKQKIIEQGQQANKIYIIMSGQVGISVKLAGQGLEQVCKLNQHDFFGEVSMIGGIPNTATVTAIKRTTCIIFSQKQFYLLSQLDHTQEIISKIYQATVSTVFNRLIQSYSQLKKKDPHFSIHEFSLLEKPLRCITIDKSIVSNYVEIMKNFYCFRDMSHAELKLITSYGSFIKLKRGRVIYKYNDSSNYLYLCLRGGIQEVLSNGHRQYTKLNIYGPGHLFGHDILIDGAKRPSTCFARENCLLLRISVRNYNEIKHTHPNLWHRLYYALCKSLVWQTYISNRNLAVLTQGV